MLTSSCNAFLDRLASGQPVPGGGGASALCGALGAALGSMVCHLTLGKKKYADVQQDIERLLQQAESLRAQLQDLVQQDAVAFEPLSQAYGLPKSTPEELAHREEVMARCLRDACQVPLDIMEVCTQVIAMLEELAQKGSRIALSDVGVGAAFCHGALEGQGPGPADGAKSRQHAGQMAASRFPGGGSGHRFPAEIRRDYG